MGRTALMIAPALVSGQLVEYWVRKEVARFV
jgi:hypothetical protein